MFTALRAFFASGDIKAQQLYGKLVAGSREPAFYSRFGVPDTVEGRYDMLLLHVVLLFCRLRDDDAQRAFAQEVFDAMFADMDRGLRDAGVGDISVPKRMKKLAQIFYGRAEAYDVALASGDINRVADVIARNVYRQELQDAPGAHEVARYALAAFAVLRAASFDDIRDGRLALPIN